MFPAIILGMKGREERVIRGELTPSVQSSSPWKGNSMFEDEQEPFEVLVDKGFSTGQLAQLEDNTLSLEQREREIESILRSISDINEMYKDLATMIVEQVWGLLKCKVQEWGLLWYRYEYYSKVWEWGLVWNQNGVEIQLISDVYFPSGNNIGQNRL